MNARQKQVLSSLVELYTETAQPIGSLALLERFGFPVSSATLRNDMVSLEDEGYLYQPHTSAGRIPTDQGYRFYVEEIMGDESLSLGEQQQLKKELLQLRAKHVRLGRSAAKLLSALSGNLAVSGLIDREEFYDFGMREMIDKPEFREIDELSRLVEMLDTLDTKIEQMIGNVKEGEARIFIGEENPIREIQNCAMIVAPYQSPEGQGGTGYHRAEAHGIRQEQVTHPVHAKAPLSRTDTGSSCFSQYDSLYPMIIFEKYEEEIR
ncbi:MAG: hypothetical protein WDN67_04715 [Candidatus Moraniibacteriota bacterium]